MIKLNKIEAENSAAMVAMLLVFGMPILAMFNLLNNFTTLLLLIIVVFFIIRPFFIK